MISRLAGAKDDLEHHRASILGDFYSILFYFIIVIVIILVLSSSFFYFTILLLFLISKLKDNFLRVFGEDYPLWKRAVDCVAEVRILM